MATALITGASSGIGYELAKLFARDKHDLVLAARSGLKLLQFAGQLEREFGVSVRTVQIDLALPESPQQLFEELRGADIAVDILVNNAAYGKFGNFAEIPVEDSLGQIHLNITALTHLTKLFLGPMLAKRTGKILNVASTAAFQAGPLMSVYYASKNFRRKELGGGRVGALRASEISHQYFALDNRASGLGASVRGARCSA
jgi:short-subunit dehydrogenase